MSFESVEPGQAQASQNIPRACFDPELFTNKNIKIRARASFEPFCKIWLVKSSTFKSFHVQSSTLKLFHIKSSTFRLSAQSRSTFHRTIAPGTYLLRAINSARALSPRPDSYHLGTAQTTIFGTRRLCQQHPSSFPHQLNSATFRADNLSMNFSKRDIPCVNYRMHTMHCMRNIGLCQICDEPIPRKDLESHQQSW